jgi:magnesium chelatase family protein
MVGAVHTTAVVGLEPVPVTVEAHVGAGLPGLHVIGASGSAAREAADRVRTALATVAVRLSAHKALVSLAPADIPKVGARFDLPIAVAVLVEQGLVPAAAVADAAFVGELALDGGVRRVPGVLPAAVSLPAAGVRRLVVADGNAAEAALAGCVEVVPVADLAETVAVLGGARRPRPVPPTAPPARAPALDLADVRGQLEARRALEIAAAGGHHVLLVGPPGCGKSMLAARLPSLLPPLSTAEALEVTAIRSVAGRLGADDGLDHVPPFSAPHHGASMPALLGGGSGVARPGALSLAHHGVLFLDELYEWPRRLLEALREPLAEGVVRLARARASVTYPCRTLLVCAANPCPCGGGAGCACTDEAIWTYRSRLSGPLADRLDLAPAVEPLTAQDLLARDPGEPSSAVAARVHAARAMAAERWGGRTTNSAVPAAAVRRSAAGAALRELAGAVESGGLTGRGFERALRVARTVADLAGEAVIGREHALEALAHRLPLAAPSPVPAVAR